MSGVLRLLLSNIPHMIRGMICSTERETSRVTDSEISDLLGILK